MQVSKSQCNAIVPKSTFISGKQLGTEFQLSSKKWDSSDIWSPIFVATLKSKNRALKTEDVIHINEIMLMERKLEDIIPGENNRLETAFGNFSIEYCAIEKSKTVVRLTIGNQNSSDAFQAEVCLATSTIRGQIRAWLRNFQPADR